MNTPQQPKQQPKMPTPGPTSPDHAPNGVPKGLEGDAVQARPTGDRLESETASKP